MDEPSDDGDAMVQFGGLELSGDEDGTFFTPSPPPTSRVSKNVSILSILFHVLKCFIIKTLVKIEPGHNSSSKADKNRPGIKDLPAQCQADFSTKLSPLLIRVLGASKRPWEVPGNSTLQKIWDKVYPRVQYDAKSIARPVCSFIALFLHY